MTDTIVTVGCEEGDPDISGTSAVSVASACVHCVVCSVAVKVTATVVGVSDLVMVSEMTVGVGAA